MEKFAKKVMLAASESPTWEQIEKHLPLFGSFKMDGCRGTIQSSKAISRKALPFENKFVQAWAKEHEVALMGLDGEFVVGPPRMMHDDDDVFNRSSGPIGKVEGQPDFAFYAFDLHDAGQMPADERYHKLKDLIEYAQTPRVLVVEQRLLHSIADVKAMMAEAVALGYEGLILKHPKKPYKNGRSTLLEGIMMKLKEWVDSECVILGVNQGTTNKNKLETDELGHAKRSTAKAGKIPTETIGSWIVKDLYSGVPFKCPPNNHTEAELKALWIEHNTPGGSHEGRIMTYKYQKVGTIKKPRFPGALRFRPVFDIDPERVHPDLRHFLET